MAKEIKKTTSAHIAAPTPEQIKANEERFPLTRVNFWLMIAAGVLIVVGFILMLGSGSSPENGFNADIFSNRRIVVGPIISFAGFIFMGYGIIYRKRK